LYTFWSVEEGDGKVIVRLMGEGQYELDKNHLDEINRIDNNIVKIINRGDEKAIKTTFKI